MKRFFSILLALALTLSFAACGSSKEEAASSAIFSEASSYDYENFNYNDGLNADGYWEGVKALDYVTLPELSSIQITQADVLPTEADIQTQWNALLSQYATSEEVTGRAAQSGDIADIDYVGTVDGVAFTGGSYEGYQLTLGSGTFIDGFEDQVIGHAPGESFTITVTFPEGYGDSTDAEGNTVALSGQEAEFAVTINALYQTVYPAVTDDWVAENYGESNGLYSVSAVSAYFEESLYFDNLDNAIFDTLTEESEFNGCPEVISAYQASSCLNYYYQLANMYGYTMDEFLPAYTGYASADELLADYTEELTSYCNEALLYQAVAEKLGIVATDDSVADYADYVSVYGENYVRMIGLIDLVTKELRSQVSIV